jgi:hypothetical protein
MKKSPLIVFSYNIDNIIEAFLSDGSYVYPQGITMISLMKQVQQVTSVVTLS